jgi:hypothetical protein
MTEEFNALEEIISQSIGIDKNKEIFNLWYEINFQRNILNHIISNNPDMASCITQLSIDIARENAKIDVETKFPNCKLTFTDPEIKKN